MRLGMSVVPGIPRVTALSFGMADELEDHHQAMPWRDPIQRFINVHRANVKGFAPVPCANGFFQIGNFSRLHKSSILARAVAA